MIEFLELVFDMPLQSIFYTLSIGYMIGLPLFLIIKRVFGKKKC